MLELFRGGALAAATSVHPPDPLIGDRGERVCTASSSLGTSHLYSPGIVFHDEDLEAHKSVFCTLNS